MLPYVRERGITSALNISELCAYLLGKGLRCDGISEKVLEAFVVVEKIPLDTAISAAELRHEMRRKGKRWSYVDIIRYLLARQVRALFLTGDREFRDVEGVEFVG